LTTTPKECRYDEQCEDGSGEDERWFAVPGLDFVKGGTASIASRKCLVLLPLEDRKVQPNERPQATGNEGQQQVKHMVDRLAEPQRRKIFGTALDLPAPPNVVIDLLCEPSSAIIV
jgi:hypothetical protein